MRKHLASDTGVRKKFRAKFSRFGKKTNYRGYTEETILLVQVIDVETQNVVTGHIWFSYTKGFQKIDLVAGMTLEFEARIKMYKKGYVNRRWEVDKRSLDYKLGNPTKIAVVHSL
jgi:hypothetical protein